MRMKTNTECKPLITAGSLMLLVFANAASQDLAAQGLEASKRAVIVLQSAAARGDADAMFKVAMLHIEGTVVDADYDYGVRLLKRSASKGNSDAQRMYAFMDNAFSGEGC